MKPALLVIDMQNGWLTFSPGLKKSVADHIDTVNKVISIFQSANAPIIFTFHSYAEHGIVKETKEFEIMPEISITKDCKKIIKTHQNAYIKTNLAKIIRENGCDTVMIAGLSALNCVLSTYLATYDENLFPYLVKGAVAGPDEKSVQIAETICDTLSLRAISQILGQDPKIWCMP